MDEWEQTPAQLGEVADVFVGFPFRSETFVTEGVKLLRGDNISQGYIDWADAQKLAPELAADFANYELCEGDIVLAMDRPWVGAGLKFASIREKDAGALLVQRTARLRGSEAARTEFLRYVIASPAYSKYIKGVTTGSLVPHISKQQIQDFRFFLPSLDDQQKIASVLSALDAKIDLNHRINAELEALSKTVYDYWFVQFDFPDAHGRPYKSNGGAMVWNDTLKREIPAGWEPRYLAQLVLVSTSGINPADEPEKEFRHLSIPSFDQSGSFLVEPGSAIGSNKFTVQKHDLLVSKLNPWTNRVVADTDHDDLICSTELVVWRCGDATRQAFLNAIATHPRFIMHCTQSANGTSHSHKRVNPQVMMGFQIPYCPRMAEKFGELAAPLLAQKVRNAAENRELTSLRDWLLPLLMNGQVRVA